MQNRSTEGQTKTLFQNYWWSHNWHGPYNANMVVAIFLLMFMTSIVLIFAVLMQHFPFFCSERGTSPRGTPIISRCEDNFICPVIVLFSLKILLKIKYQLCFSISARSVASQNLYFESFWITKHVKRKRKISHSALWQKPLHPHKTQNVTTYKCHQKRRLHNDCGPTQNGQLG